MLSLAEEKKALDRFEAYCVETMRKRREEGTSSEDTILSDLSSVSLQDLPSKDIEEKDENSGSTLGKRKRKTTALMKESLDQDKEQDESKKRRKGNMEKENINGTNQLATAKQKGKKLNEKRQQEIAAKSTVDSMGQLMFTSKYGSKFPSNPTNPPHATPIPTATLKPPIPTSTAPQAPHLHPPAHSDAVTLTKPPILPATAPQATHLLPAAHSDAVTLTKPPILPATAPQATHLLPAAHSDAVTLTKPPIPPATAPQGASLVSPVPGDTVPSTKSPIPTTAAPQAAHLLPAALGVTEPSTNPPIPRSPALQAAYSCQLPAATEPTPPASNPDTSISQTWAECDRALVLCGLRDILNNPPRDDDVIIVESDQNTPEQSLLNTSATPSSTLHTFTVERNLQKIAAENKRLEAENTSLKAELSALKGQLAIMAPGE